MSFLILIFTQTFAVDMAMLNNNTTNCMPKFFWRTLVMYHVLHINALNVPPQSVCFLMLRITVVCSLSNVGYSNNYKTQCFAHWICFRPRVREREESPPALGPFERANLNCWTTYVILTTSMQTSETRPNMPTRRVIVTAGTADARNRPVFH
jgi:hypothetical protein